MVSCEPSSEEVPEREQANDEIVIDEEEDDEEVSEDSESDYLLPEIDLSNWKVTLPIGRPDEVKPPEILDYATNEKLLPFMYNDSTDGSLVFLHISRIVNTKLLIFQNGIEGTNGTGE